MNTRIRYRSLLTCGLIALLTVGGICGYQCLAQKKKSPSRIAVRTVRARPLQRNPKKHRVVHGLKKMGAKAETPKKIRGKIVSMQAALQKRSTVAGNRRQTKISRAKAARPVKGRGRQRKKAVARRASEKSHLKLTLRISDSGAATVVTAVEAPGIGAKANLPHGRFIYEVSTDRESLAVGTLPDPFEMRGFPAPGKREHSIARAKTATIRVTVPNMSLKDRRLQKMKFQGFKLRSATPLHEISPKIVSRLRHAKKLESRYQISARKLAPQIRRKGRSIRAKTIAPKRNSSIRKTKPKTTPLKRIPSRSSRIRGPF